MSRISKKTVKTNTTSYWIQIDIQKSTAFLSTNSQLPEREMKKEEQQIKNEGQQNSPLIPDLSDADEARKAFIASEIFNRKY